MGVFAPGRVKGTRSSVSIISMPILGWCGSIFHLCLEFRYALITSLRGSIAVLPMLALPACLWMLTYKLQNGNTERAIIMARYLALIKTNGLCGRMLVKGRLSSFAAGLVELLAKPFDRTNNTEIEQHENGQKGNERPEDGEKKGTSYPVIELELLVLLPIQVSADQESTKPHGGSNGRPDSKTNIQFRHAISCSWKA